MGNKVVENDALEGRIRARRDEGNRKMIQQELGETPKLARGGYDSSQLRRARERARRMGRENRYPTP